MRTIFFLFFISSAFAQSKLKISGDWILLPPDRFVHSKELSQIVKIEQFMDQYYIVAVEGDDYPLSLHRAQKFTINEDLFFEVKALKDGNSKKHYFYWLENWTQDTLNLSLLISTPIELGDEDVIKNGNLLKVDSNKITFDLIYSESDLAYTEKDNTWSSSFISRRVILWEKNPKLFKYIMKVYGKKIVKIGLKQTYCRWSYLKWDKVNLLKSKEVTTVIRLDRSVHHIFETASINELLKFKKGEESPPKKDLLLNNYHLVRANSVGFRKVPNFFKNGSKIKVKTNLWNRGLYDATHKKLYYSEAPPEW
ncbi:hypothetical protein [Aureispira anguillae]|uniref:Uncharacterized protein n=1 Tax=Aureispira anguillae TaxID=2864201 RepID=A0A915YDP8_9BACT|nr:hypothetical protein [Aureispira anguillae]BDS11210.1 hypothetical protein AsAng_0019220 [Aureispira anguillae]